MFISKDGYFSIHANHYLEFLIHSRNKLFTLLSSVQYHFLQMNILAFSQKETSNCSTEASRHRKLLCMQVGALCQGQTSCSQLYYYIIQKINGVFYYFVSRRMKYGAFKKLFQLSTYARTWKEQHIPYHERDSIIHINMC